MYEREIRVRTTDGEMTTFVVHPDGAARFRWRCSTWTRSATASR